MKAAISQDEDDIKIERGMIAPGMSVVFTIRFTASSFAEFKDSLTIISESGSF